MSDWFKQWFGKEYLELYPHRDEHEAHAAVQLVRDTIKGPEIGLALDLACGSGRHSRALREWVWTVGLDLSIALLGVATTESPGAPYVRGDMRALPFADHAFGLVVNFFTSFRIISTQMPNICESSPRWPASLVQAEPSSSTTANARTRLYRCTLVPFTERVVDGRTIRQRRRISADGRYVEKSIDADGCDKTYQERVRLFTPDELRMMLEESGIR